MTDDLLPNFVKRLQSGQVERTLVPQFNFRISPDNVSIRNVHHEKVLRADAMDKRYINLSFHKQLTYPYGLSSLDNVNNQENLVLLNKENTGN